MRIASHIVIYPWIRGRQPTTKLLLQLVAYEVVFLAYTLGCGNIKRLRTFDLIQLKYQVLHED
jgi:hypothetical protein